VLFACSLDSDLKQLSLGDETSVGEKGTVLSGGQKARISLARAIYSSSKFILLDDVLSAVDSHTSSHLFEHVLMGRLMAGRTCILVTHAVDLCLPGAAFVVTMDSNGTITSSGPPNLIDFDSPSITRPNFPAFVATNANIEVETNETAVDSTIEDLLDVDEEAEAERKKKQFELIKDETQSTGAVSREVYTVYIKAFGGLSILIFAVSIFVAAQLAEIGGPSSHRVSRNRVADLVHVSRGLIGVKSLGITVRF
jgi:ABC-type proline/glycine betaine transport system ATPase subunit